MRIGFVEWLEERLYKNNLLAVDLANKLHMTPASISHYRHGRIIPRYPTVVAMCSSLGGEPETVWKMIKEGD